MRNALLPLLLVAALPVIAQPVYSYKDSSGNTVYTNQQPPANTNAKEINLPKIHTISSSNLNQGVSTPRNEVQQAPIINRVFIRGIPQNEPLRENDGNINITIVAESSTALPSSYQYLLLLDGSPYGDPQANPNFTLTNIDRGNHALQAQVLNNGRIIASSNIQTFTLLRQSQPVRTPHPPIIPQPRVAR